eukprot:g6572.t1
MAEEKKSGSLGATCIDTCCWQTRGSFDHASIERWLFELNDQVGKENRSCIERCYLCGTKPKSPRPVEIPEKLRGIIYQADSVDGKAKNGVLITHTWNYAKWYPEQRLLVSRIHEPSSWTFREPIVTRCMNCSSSSSPSSSSSFSSSPSSSSSSSSSPSSLGPLRRVA